VIAGEAKGRRLLQVAGTGTRPITGRVKTALFDVLSNQIEEATFLDLFAGTGSVGIEALSRGATKVVFVDRSRKAIETVRRNLEITGLSERAKVVRADAFHFVARASADLLFDYIYVAPPQYRELWAKMLLALHGKPLLARSGAIIVQIHPKEFHETPTPRLQLVQQRRYGSTLLCFYRCRPPIMRVSSEGEGREEETDLGQRGE